MTVGTRADVGLCVAEAGLSAGGRRGVSRGRVGVVTAWYDWLWYGPAVGPPICGFGVESKPPADV